MSMIRAALRLLRRSSLHVGAAMLALLVPALALADEVCPGDGLVVRFVPCVRDKIGATAGNFFVTVYPIMETIINIALLLSVVFFGVLLAIGQIRRASKSTFVLLIKIGAVVLFTSNLQMIYDWSISIMDGLIEIVSTFKFTGGTLHCPITDDYNGVWGRIDCVINSLIGVNGDGKGLTQLAHGMLSFLFGTLTSGSLGVLMFLVGTYMCFNITMSMLRACIIYLLSLMMLVLIVVAGLFFIPLILFKSSGMAFFERWSKMLAGVILQPVIVFAFLNIVLVALDVTMFSGPDSVFRTIAGDAVDKADFSLSQYMEDNNLYVAKKAVPGIADVTPQATDQEPVGSTINWGWGGGNNGRNDKPVNPKDPGSIQIGIEYRAIDFDKVRSARKGGPALPSDDKQGMMWAMASAILMAGLVSYLMIQLLGYMPKLAADLGGGLKEAADVATRGNEIPGERYLSRGVTGVTRQIEGLIGGRGGK